MNIIDFQPVIWNVLLKSIRLNKLSNAYLFYGPEGCGKEWTALEFARILNCFNKDDAHPVIRANHALSLNPSNTLIFL